MIEILNWIGTICYCICAIPQSRQAWMTKSVAGMRWDLLLLWAGGEVSMLAYSLYVNNNALLTNYVVNGICLGILLFVKWREEEIGAKILSYLFGISK